MKVWAISAHMSLLLAIKAFSCCYKHCMLFSGDPLGIWFVGSYEINGRDVFIAAGLLPLLLLLYSSDSID